MKNIGKIASGIILLLLGVALILEISGTININYNGWWTFFIIIPCLISLFTSKNKFLPLIGIGTGVLLLLATRGIICWNNFGLYMISLVVIIIGLMLIFGRTCAHGCTCVNTAIDDLKQVDQDGRSIRVIKSSFCKQSYDFANQRFEGAKVETSFGFVGIDLRGADILDGAVIDLECAFGGMEIRVDNDINIQRSVKASFAGVECNNHFHPADNAKTLYIKGECSFGGIEIK